MFMKREDFDKAFEEVAKTRPEIYKYPRWLMWMLGSIGYAYGWIKGFIAGFAKGLFNMKWDTRD